MTYKSKDLIEQFNNSTGDDGIDFLRLLKRESLTNDAITGTGPYVAQVLRVEKFAVGEGDGWINNIRTNLSNDNINTTSKVPNPLDDKNWIRVYARITSDYLPGQPNIHSHIPMPKQLGSITDLKDDNRSNTLITMHTAFIGKVQNSSLPTPGDFIWVDYLDKSNLKKPVFIEKIVTAAGGVPCLDGTCAPPSLAYIPDKGASLNKVEKNENLNTPGSRQPETFTSSRSIDNSTANKTYELKGYKAEDFTSYNDYIEGKYKGEFEVTLSIMEIITFHFQNMFPEDNITIKSNKNPGIAYPPRQYFNSKENRHHMGKAFDVEVYKNNKPIDKSIIWASIMKLIDAGKIPDGGVGFYQTNADKGPNSGISTTFGTDLPASDWPHYDWDIKNNRPEKWIEASLDNKDVIFSSTTFGKWAKASEWMQATLDGLTHMPPQCIDALISSSTNAHESLPTYLDALAARQQIEKDKTHNPSNKTLVKPGLGAALLGSFGTPLGNVVLKEALDGVSLEEASLVGPPSLTQGNVFIQGSWVDPRLFTEPPAGFEAVRDDKGQISFKPVVNTCVGQVGNKKSKIKAKLTDEKLALLNTAANLPPGLLIDQNVMAKPGRRGLENVSIFVVHEVASEGTPRAICVKRKNNIAVSKIRGATYTTLEEKAEKELINAEVSRKVGKIKKGATREERIKHRQLRRKAKREIEKKRKDSAASSTQTKAEPNPFATKEENWQREKRKKQEQLLKQQKAKAAEQYKKSKQALDAAQKDLKKANKDYKNAKSTEKSTIRKYIAEAKKAVKKAQRQLNRTIKYNEKIGTRTKKGAIRVRKDFSAKGLSRWNPSKTVHFWSGRAGEIVVGSDWSRKLAHANWSNNWSVGNENCVGWGGYVAVNKSRGKSYRAIGGKVIGKHNGFWGTVHPKNVEQLFLQLGISGEGWHGEYGRTMPNLIMMERQFQLTQWLGSDKNPYSDIYSGFDPNWFPCTLNSVVSPFKTWGAIRKNSGISEELVTQSLTIRRRGKDFTIPNRKLGKKNYKKQYNRRINKLLRQQKAAGKIDLDFKEPEVNTQVNWFDITAPLFCWGFFSPDHQKYGRKGSPRPGGWKKGLRSSTKVKAKYEWQRGITAHTRWGPHTDGCIIEYYILGRVLGMSPEDAFYACVGAWCSAGNRDNKGVLNAALAYKNPKLIIPPKRFTYFPDNKDADYVSLGKAIWKGNPRIHHKEISEKIITISDIQKSYNNLEKLKNNKDKKNKKPKIIIKEINFEDGNQENPLDWFMARGSLYDPKAKILIPGKNYEINEVQIPENRAHKETRPKRVVIGGKKRYVYLYGENAPLPGPFASKSHYTAEPGTRNSPIPGGENLDFLK